MVINIKFLLRLSITKNIKITQERRRKEHHCQRRSVYKEVEREESGAKWQQEVLTSSTIALARLIKRDEVLCRIFKTPTSSKQPCDALT